MDKSLPQPGNASASTPGPKAGAGRQKVREARLAAARRAARCARRSRAEPEDGLTDSHQKVQEARMELRQRQAWETRKRRKQAREADARGQ